MNRSLRLKTGLYLNYLIHGVGLLILTQNMTVLSHAWSTSLATVSYVISGVGIGRLLAYYILGYLSDRFGRKPMVYLGMLSYALFFIGMAYVRDFKIAYLFAILAGIANSALDDGTYPTLSELDQNGSTTILIKAAMSLGEFILPLLVSFNIHHNLWYGWPFLLAVLILLLNFIFLIYPSTFPATGTDSTTINETSKTKWNLQKVILTIAFVIYGYVSMALMIHFTQWITLYAQNVKHLSVFNAHFLLSLYSVGSIIGVLVVFFLARMVKSTYLILALNTIALIALIGLDRSNTALILKCWSFVFGFSAASGVMQLGLNAFSALFPNQRGRMTGIFFSFGSIASFTIPIITGWLSKSSLAVTFRSDTITALIAVILSIIFLIFLPKTQEQTA